MRTLREQRGRNKKDEIQQNKTLQREEKTRERDTERDTNEREWYKVRTYKLG